MRQDVMVWGAARAGSRRTMTVEALSPLVGGASNGAMTLQDALSIDPQAALVLIDIQLGFDDPRWGTPGENAARALEHMHDLARVWTTTGRAIVVVRHDSVLPDSPLRTGSPGNALRDWVGSLRADVLVTKQVNSAFIGEPDLDAWLQDRGIDQIVVVGIQTNMCVETTSRMGGNLGYDVIVPIDATSTFDLLAPDGSRVTAAELTRVTSANLHGEFATVSTTPDVLDAARWVPTMTG